MSVSVLAVLASVNNSGSVGALTLIFPLVFVFVVLGLWWVSLRRSRGGD
jgi:hypothetical protein